MTAKKRDPRVAPRQPPWITEKLKALAEARAAQKLERKRQRLANKLARKRLTVRQERLREIDEVLAREAQWAELRATRKANWAPSGCDGPTPEQIHVFRELYPGRDGTRGTAADWARSDLGRYGDGRLDLGYRYSNKVT
jgi:hypothetical protein